MASNFTEQMGGMLAEARSKAVAKPGRGQGSGSGYPRSTAKSKSRSVQGQAGISMEQLEEFFGLDTKESVLARSQRDSAIYNMFADQEGETRFGAEMRFHNDPKAQDFLQKAHAHGSPYVERYYDQYTGTPKYRYFRTPKDETRTKILVLQDLYNKAQNGDAGPLMNYLQPFTETGVKAGFAGEKARETHIASEKATQQPSEAMIKSGMAGQQAQQGWVQGEQQAREPLAGGRQEEAVIQETRLRSAQANLAITQQKLADADLENQPLKKLTAKLEYDKAQYEYDILKQYGGTKTQKELDELDARIKYYNALAAKNEKEANDLTKGKLDDLDNETLRAVGQIIEPYRAARNAWVKKQEYLAWYKQPTQQRSMARKELLDTQAEVLVGLKSINPKNTAGYQIMLTTEMINGLHDEIGLRMQRGVSPEGKVVKKGGVVEIGGARVLDPGHADYYSGLQLFDTVYNNLIDDEGKLMYAASPMAMKKLISVAEMMGLYDHARVLQGKLTGKQQGEEQPVSARPPAPAKPASIGPNPAEAERQRKFKEIVTPEAEIEEFGGATGLQTMP